MYLCASISGSQLFRSRYGVELQWEWAGAGGPLPPPKHSCPPLYKECYETQSTLCFDSYEPGHESLPPRLEKVTVELRLCHQRPIFDCWIFAAVRVLKSTVGCSLVVSVLFHFVLYGNIFISRLYKFTMRPFLPFTMICCWTVSFYPFFINL